MRCTLNCNWRGVQCTKSSSGEESCHAAIFHPFPAWQSDAMPSTQMFFTILKYRLKDRNTSNVFQYIAMKYCTLRSILLKLFPEDSSCLHKSAVLFLRDTLSTFWHYTLSVNNPGDRKHVGFGKFWSESDMKMSFTLFEKWNYDHNLFTLLSMRNWSELKIHQDREILEKL